MNDKFSLYQTDGLWGIIENTSNEKQTSIKSYFGSDLIIKRLNEQDQQIDRLKQQLAEKDTRIAEIEDTMEEYGIESVEKLSNALEFAKVIENILSEYGIKDNEELDMKLANFDNFMKGNKFETIEDLQNALNGKFIEVFDEKNKIWQDIVEKLVKTEKDRDTWQKACELACGTIISEEIDGEDLYDVIEKWKVERDIEMYGFDDRLLTDYFYQQAKKGNKKVQIHYCTNDETNKILGDIKIKDDFSTTMQNLAKMYADTLKDLDTAEDKDN